MTTFHILDPESPESLRITLFFWRLRKAAAPGIMVVTIVAFAALVTTSVGPLFVPKSREQRLAAKVEAKLKPASYRQVGPWGRLAGS